MVISNSLYITEDKFCVVSREVEVTKTWVSSVILLGFLSPTYSKDNH